MPRKNGMEAYLQMKKLRPDIRGISSSGYVEDVFSKDGLPLEEETFLLKPFLPTDLLRKVRKVLDRQT